MLRYIILPETKIIINIFAVRLCVYGWSLRNGWLNWYICYVYNLMWLMESINCAYGKYCCYNLTEFIHIWSRCINVIQRQCWIIVCRYKIRNNRVCAVGKGTLLTTRLFMEFACTHLIAIGRNFNVRTGYIMGCPDLTNLCPTPYENFDLTFIFYSLSIYRYLSSGV